MRPEVIRLVELGPLPTEDDERPEDEIVALLSEYERNLDALERPVTDEEAMALLKVFHPSGDSCFGLAWTLLHSIETAPNWPARPATSEMGKAFESRLQGSDEPWLQFLWQRILNWRERHEAES